MYVPPAFSGVLDHLPVLSHSLQFAEVWMAFLSDGMWFLVDLMGIPPVTISDAEHLVLWLFGVVCLLFFPLKGVGKIYLYNWLPESLLCLESISAALTQVLFWRQLSLTAPQALWLGGASKFRCQSCSYRKCPQGSGTSSCPSLLPPGTRAIGKVSFLGCELVWNVLSKLPRPCVSLLLPSAASPLPSRIMRTWDTPPYWGAYEAAPSGRKLQLGTPALWIWILGDFTLVLVAR